MYAGGITVYRDGAVPEGTHPHAKHFVEVYLYSNQRVNDLFKQPLV